jgi:hypothetical protein
VTERQIVIAAEIRTTVEVANAGEPLIALGGRMKSGLEALAVTGEDGIGARAIRQLKPDGVGSAEQLPGLLAELKDERWPRVGCFDGQGRAADDEQKVGRRRNDAAVGDPKGGVAPFSAGELPSRLVEMVFVLRGLVRQFKVGRVRNDGADVEPVEHIVEGAARSAQEVSHLEVAIWIRAQR